MGKKITIIAITFAVLAVTQPAYAQQSGKVWRIGTLFSGSPATHGHFVEWLQRGFRDLGYVEGRTYVVISRWAMGKRKRLPALAKELVKEKVVVIVVNGSTSIRAVKKATKTVPIVVGASATLLKYVGSPTGSRGNITGSTYDNYALGTKRLALLKTALPKARRIAYLFTARGTKSLALKGAESAGKVMGVEIEPVAVQAVGEFESIFASMVNQRFDGLMIRNRAFLNFHRKRIAALAIKYKLPTMCERAQFAQAGCLFGYSADREHMMRRAAHFIDKILKGAKPADLPVEVATHYRFAVNLKTAKALGITLPPSILLQATDVIE
ncbi:MAG: ABC transporter substrate-binding protein [Alphaproteobacteria bacterium]|nr:ABC transporter substrate-binding protein [Alphaproteobacteria bacterium]